MNTQKNSFSPNFVTRLAAFLLVLVFGLALGWWNGSSDDLATSGIVQQGAVSTDSGADETTTENFTSTDATQQTNNNQGTSSTEESSSVTSPDTSSSGTGTDTTTAPERGPTVEKDGWYTSKEEVALYIHTYGRLPGNFISKTKARAKGWVASEGNLDDVCPGMSIGGSRFYNDDGKLPDKRGRQWTECDINYQGGYRGSERIVFSNDGLVYYTADHYETFERLY